MSATDDRLLSPDYLDHLQSRPIEEIRSMREECEEVETGLSYLRRMGQGPLDIVSRELVRREVGGHADRSTLIEELPGILADGPRPPGVGRLSRRLEPTDIDHELAAELDEILGRGVLADVTQLSDQDLLEVREHLEVFEHRVSERRQAYFDRIDALKAELARRYRTGEASVDGLLD
jgi:hypothetical protein